MVTRPGLLLLLPLALVAGCDPCAGLGACGAPLVRFDGEVRTSYPVGAAADIRVDFVPTGGVALEEETLTGRSDREGRFRLEGRAREEGEVVGTLIFHPPEPIGPVRYEGVRLTTTRAAGEASFGGQWGVPWPHLPYEAHFYNRQTGGPAAGIEIEFRRTGGIPVEPDTFRVTTDAFGNVKLRPLTRVAGELTGELVVHPLPPYGPYTIPDLRMSTFTMQRIDSTLVRSGIGLHLPYAGVLYWEDTGLPAAGIELEFRRTGGVPIEPDPFVTVPDSYGTFHVNPAPLATGEVEGELVVRSADGPTGYVLRFLRLPVHERDAAVLNMGPFFIPRP